MHHCYRWRVLKTARFQRPENISHFESYYAISSGPFSRTDVTNGLGCVFLFGGAGIVWKGSPRVGFQLNSTVGTVPHGGGACELGYRGHWSSRAVELQWLVCGVEEERRGTSAKVKPNLHLVLLFPTPARLAETVEALRADFSCRFSLALRSWDLACLCANN